MKGTFIMGNFFGTIHQIARLVFRVCRNPRDYLFVLKSGYFFPHNIIESQISEQSKNLSQNYTLEVDEVLDSGSLKFRKFEDIEMLAAENEVLRLELTDVLFTKLNSEDTDH